MLAVHVALMRKRKNVFLYWQINLVKRENPLHNCMLITTAVVSPF